MPIRSNNPKPTLLITGGAGFLGYHVCSMLSQTFAKIIVVDIATINPHEYPDNIMYTTHLDVRNIDALLDVSKGVDFVIHAAAALPLWKMNDIYDVNVNGTRNVLEAAHRSKVKRVIVVSSTAVYGITPQHPTEESHPLIGVGPYGKSKIIAEQICNEYRQKGLIVSTIRPKTFIGAGRLGVFQILYDWIESGKQIPIIGNGTNRYQLLDVEDLVEAILLLLMKPSHKVNDTFNLGAEIFETVNKDIGALCKFAQSGASVLPIPAWLVKPVLSLFYACRLSPLYPWIFETADKDTYVSIDKLQKATRWKPKWSNTQALIRSYSWYLEHKNELSTGITHRAAWKQGMLGLVKHMFLISVFTRYYITSSVLAYEIMLQKIFM